MVLEIYSYALNQFDLRPLDLLIPLFFAYSHPLYLSYFSIYHDILIRILSYLNTIIWISYEYMVKNFLRISKEDQNQILITIPSIYNLIKSFIFQIILINKKMTCSIISPHHMCFITQ